MQRLEHPMGRRIQRGVAAVEMGLLLGPLVLLLFGATELGRAIFSYNMLDKTVRDAARHLSQHGPGDPDIAAQAVCLAVYGDAAVSTLGTCTGTTPVAPGLTASNIVTCDALSCASTHAGFPTGLGTINLVSVRVQGYSFSSLVSFVVPSMTFNNIEVTMRAQL